MEKQIEFLQEIERQIKAGIDQVNENIKDTGAKVWYPDTFSVTQKVKGEYYCSTYDMETGNVNTVNLTTCRRG